MGLICVGIPAHDGKVCAQTVDSLLSEQALGADILVLWEIGGGAIGFARNRIARRFLQIPGAETLVFVDADISWKGGELRRLAQRAEVVVGGTYLGKHAGSTFHVDGLPERKGDLWRVDGLPGGFLKIDRQAFEQIPADRYLDPDGQETADFFPTGFHHGRYYGEDYGFCRKWRSTGGDVWLDPTFVLRHHDGGTVYEGDPRKWLEAWP